MLLQVIAFFNRQLDCLLYPISSNWYFFISVAKAIHSVAWTKREDN